MDAIDAFIAEQAQEGERDSVGSFTVSAEKALDKLSSHQLPRTSAWVLKMVQAGVRGQAKAIRFSHSSKSCRVVYEEPELGDLEELRAKFMDPGALLTAGQRELMVGLRAVAFARKRAVLMTHNSSEFGVRTVFWNGKTLSGVNQASSNLRLHQAWPREGEMVFFVSGSPLGHDETVQRLHGVKEVVAAEFKELHNFAVCCPVPLSVDARGLNHFGMEDVSMTRKAVAFSAQPATGSENSTLALPSFRSEVDFGHGAEFCWTLYHTSQPGPSRVSWVKNGVVCEEETLHSRHHDYNLRLFLPADHLETDLTALQLRHDREVSFRQLASAVEHVCSELVYPSPLFSAIAEKQGKEGSWAGVFGLILGGLFFAPATSGLSLLGGVGAAVGLRMHSKKSSKGRPLPKLVHFREDLLRKYRGHG